MQDWLDFAAKIAWPAVALVGILILGPGGVLRGIISDLSQSLLKITDAIQEFKATASNLNDRVEGLKSSTTWVSTLDDQLQNITVKLESISVTTQDLAISEGSRVIESSAPANSPEAEKLVVLESADQMLDDIRARWSGVVDRLRQRLGRDQFDARMVGEMAWLLVDGRRKNAITRESAELVGQLATQMKRFNRLQSSKDEWLTHDVYSAFVRGVERALTRI